MLSREASGLSRSTAVGPSYSDPPAKRDNGRPLLADRYDVLTADGRLVCRVGRSQAEQAILAGVAEGIGRKCVKYLRIARRSTVVPGLNTGSHTTQRTRNDNDDFVGGPWVREHRDMSEDTPLPLA